ncbi:hypothetical protein rpr22_CDS743 [Rickettsia prowazekii str. Rp22]|uniref:Uncharacterized protein RP760 n=3 Tax=Rickettsia prowazekii TaxID=782 RepID=Y760_RICPR|nr:DUF5460 family protein [Rickettsia prowazekii]Q9ZCI0.1 RecName: Full=Uncharacterized protein RP760 [Rickettsia prowazekii str. Madrid E]AFE49557.1 hypothetical protein M9W_03685 [Rickettsia prowazekii str. Chernikova]AFE50401.1 hypothetical protein M9Y_03690 [Rickettsia prowazekii str. Katsinyian]AGJ01574.1 Protein RecA [Rickettsia prowazekii str. NMRC Madrid E]ADE30320.1 hypothetical protein rpr22_CDS743 [Rickettsia prowazekii str. Rp22]AFE52083.1 hypothetical protein MA3_03725 [Rickettsi
MHNADCNWKNIMQSFTESPNDFSILHQECSSGLNIPINNIFTDTENNTHLLLDQTVTHNQNGTANILGKIYKVTNGYMFSQGDITSTNGANFLGLNQCTEEAAISVLQNYHSYKETLIPRASFINTLAETLNHLGLYLDNISPMEIGKYILDQFGKTYDEPTTEKSNNDTNCHEYSNSYYYVVALGTLALGSILGYTAKYVWDNYNGKNIKNENIELVRENKQLKFSTLLYENFKNNAFILDEIIKINNLNDIIKLAKSMQEFKSSISSLTNLNNEIIKLNSPSAIALNLASVSKILHEICDNLKGNDSFTTINNFAKLITMIRTENPDSEEYKASIKEILEIFSSHYEEIEELNYATPLLAIEAYSPLEIIE